MLNGIRRGKVYLTGDLIRVVLNIHLFLFKRQIYSFFLFTNPMYFSYLLACTGQTAFLKHFFLSLLRAFWVFFLCVCVCNSRQSGSHILSDMKSVQLTAVTHPEFAHGESRIEI